ncbi:hypothetical protein Pmani_007783 [Petrolisthes manimaculis]|uniref:Uncharacterized protein n=1 Tax=Petrolisthes manimaculis TaxID=1843537 RepID=A0AAE1UEF5_9EUCA|nr:hypothetical protein Pmani_007783 [Petrolisthes manimaculis]
MTPSHLYPIITRPHPHPTFIPSSLDPIPIPTFTPSSPDPILAPPSPHHQLDPILAPPWPRPPSLPRPRPHPGFRQDSNNI